jgi:orotate phosphoribosyltransferase
VARALGVRHIFVEKDAAGKLELRRNFTIGDGEKFIVVEDVVTKGGRVQETLDIVRQLGGVVVGVGTLVDRSDGKVDFGARLESLLKLPIETFEPAACPLCQAGSKAVKPGS